MRLAILRETKKKSALRHTTPTSSRSHLTPRGVSRGQKGGCTWAHYVDFEEATPRRLRGGHTSHLEASLEDESALRHTTPT